MALLTQHVKNINKFIMKKTYLLIIGIITAAISIAQNSYPDNVELGLFNNGSNGSNASSGAYAELALRIVPMTGQTYNASTNASDWPVFLILPKSDFSETDIVNIVQVNTSMYGATGTMLFQGVFDLGDPQYLYAGISLSTLSGLVLTPLTTNWLYAFTIKVTTSLAVDKTLAQQRMIRLVDQTNDDFLETVLGPPAYTRLMMGVVNQLTASVFTVLPVNLINFSGYRNGARNTLNWTVATEVNNLGFDVQRSADGVNYSSIGFVNSQAPGGFTNAELHYTFDDNSPVGKKQYYRLNQKDIDGKSKLSNIVMITGDKATILGIGGIFPNPASTLVNVIIDAPRRDKVTLIITDMTGKTVKQQQENVEMGSNTVPVDIAKLAGGSYLVKLICQSSDCQTAVEKFNKQ